uniref:Partial AB-hydrolase lipase domain-containing protein n=1 Tax=Ditylenchus dipsaci TaxID=166011 RepID=A0A915DQI0_9BILA
MRCPAQIFSSSIALLVYFVLSFPECSSCNRLPEQDMSTSEIIEYYGYPAEIHEVTTPDGYILQMHRIPFGIKENRTLNSSFSFDSRYQSKQRPVFFLQHGLLATSADWVLNLPSQSLGFLLADAGFDVWMGNFTWDEMAEYDLPAMVSTALEITKQKSLYYIGHSQGTEIMFARLASDPKFSKKINKFFALAPVSTIGHIRGLLSWIGKYLGNYIWLVKKLFGTRDFLPQTWLSRMFADIVCGEKWIDPLCDNVLFQIGGPRSRSSIRLVYWYI